MLSFEEYIGIAHFTLSCDNYMRQFVHHNREEIRQTRKKKLLRIFDIALVLLFTIDLFLFTIWLKERHQEENKLSELVWQEPINVETDSFEVPCPEVTPEGFYGTQEYANHATFVVTHYCGCSKCCGKYSGGSESDAYGALGRKLKPYRSIAVDKDIIPLGTTLSSSEGIQYIAEDTGSGVKGYHIDLFVGNHEEALKLGVKKIELFW